jgi:thiol-disulfide isomerase/thioredoxin
MKKKYTVLFLIIALSFILLMGCSTSESEAEEPEVSIEEPENETEEPENEPEEEPVYAPNFQLEGIDGKSYELSEFEGKKVILNFWATWCPYCVDEMPDLSKLADTYNDDLVVLAVNVDESESKIKSFLEDNPDISLNILLDPKGKTASTYGANALPLSIGINSDGTVETGYPGMMKYEQMEAMYNMLK